MRDETKLDKIYSYIKNSPIRTPADMIEGKKIETIPMDEGWKAACRMNSWWYNGYENLPEYYKNEYMQEIFKLKKLLLSFAGEAVCMSMYEPYLNSLFSKGQIWYGDRCEMIKGEPSRCHFNVYSLWKENKNSSDLYRIATGYALSSDGMYRQHSWIVYLKNNESRIIETTEYRELYFGFILTEEECEKFKEYI